MRDVEIGERVDNRVDDDAERRVIPPSPPPRKPSGCVVDGTSLSAVAKNGMSAARGIA
jgi:hypothetical protein